MQEKIVEFLGFNETKLRGLVDFEVGELSLRWSESILRDGGS